MSEWIDVKDKLPCNDDNVLCFFEKDGITVGYYNKDSVDYYIESDGEKFYTNEGWRDNFSWARYGKCTHWMPLPPPPKDQS